MPGDVVGLRLVPISLVHETATARSLGTSKAVVIEDVEELAQAFGLTWFPQTRLVTTAIETDVASLLVTISGIIMYAITGTWSVIPMLSAAWVVAPAVEAEAWAMTPAVAAEAWEVVPAVEAEEWETTPVVEGDFSVNEYE